ncbi:MAG: hypothetical protein QXR96_00550, partial [Candidatus Woesearchaeota archaeon]
MKDDELSIFSFIKKKNKTKNKNEESRKDTSSYKKEVKKKDLENYSEQKNIDLSLLNLDFLKIVKKTEKYSFLLFL